jgi:hypothetical protein
MPGAPTLLGVAAYPDSNMISLNWRNDGPYDEIYVYGNSSGGAYSLIKTYTDGSRKAHDHYSRSNNITYGYKLMALYNDKVLTPYSNELTRTLWSGTYTGTATGTDSASHSGSSSTVVFDECTGTDSVTHVVTINQIETDTVTGTDSYVDGQSIKVDYAYYVGRADGDVCQHGTDYKGDAGEIITTTYLTKVTDFSDQYPDLADQYKCVYSVKLIYEDLENIDVTMHISSDGGATWTDSLQSIGTGDGKAKAKEFFFMKHGQYFQFKIVHASASTTFKWLGLEIEIEKTGEYYSI